MTHIHHDLVQKTIEVSLLNIVEEGEDDGPTYFSAEISPEAETIDDLVRIHDSLGEWLTGRGYSVGTVTK